MLEQSERLSNVDQNGAASTEHQVMTRAYTKQAIVLLYRRSKMGASYSDSGSLAARGFVLLG